MYARECISNVRKRCGLDQNSPMVRFHFVCFTSLAALKAWMKASRALSSVMSLAYSADASNTLHSTSMSFLPLLIRLAFIETRVSERQGRNTVEARWFAYFNIEKVSKRPYHRPPVLG